MGKAKTEHECALLVNENMPAADGVTWYPPKGIPSDNDCLALWGVGNLVLTGFVGRSCLFNTGKISLGILWSTRLMKILHCLNYICLK